MNLFDSIQSTAFKIVATTFGYNATWHPFNEAITHNAIVLYKDATEKHGLSDVDYDTERYVIEYEKGFFIGLKESVSAGNIEKVKVFTKEGELEFIVRRMETKFDGKTIVAILNPPII